MQDGPLPGALTGSADADRGLRGRDGYPHCV